MLHRSRRSRLWAKSDQLFEVVVFTTFRHKVLFAMCFMHFHAIFAMRHFDDQSLRVLPVLPVLLSRLQYLECWFWCNHRRRHSLHRDQALLTGSAFQSVPVARYVCAVGVVPRDWEAPFLPRLKYQATRLERLGKRILAVRLKQETIDM